MAHALTQRTNGFVEMAYFGEKGWHGLGQELTHDEAINIDERALKKAGMDWNVQRAKVRFATEHGQDSANYQEFPDQLVLFRSDTKAPLGIASPKYNILQPKACLQFMADIAGAGGFELNTAGTMFGGKRFWALASIGADAPVLANDLMKGYLLIVTSVDGTLATTVKPTSTRVVCNNTLSLAMSSKGQRDITVSHRTKFDAAKVRSQLGIVEGAWASFIQGSRKLAEHEISNMRARDMTARLLVETGTVTKDDPETSTGFKSIMDLFARGAGNHGNTAWDWVNGVTEYVDHVQRAKSDSHRLANSWLGKGDDLKTEAFSRALALIA